MPAVCQHDLHDAIDQSHIRSRTLFQVKRGKLRDVDLARICDDQRDAAFEDRLPESGAEDRMLLGRVRADDEQGLRIVGDVVHGVAHRSRTKAEGQAVDGRGMAEPRAVVDVVRADHLSGELLHQIVFFVGALGRGEHGDGIRPGIRFDPA